MFALSFYLQLIEDEESKDKLSWIYENFLNVMLYTAKKIRRSVSGGGRRCARRCPENHR